MFFTGTTVPGDPAVPNEDWVAVTSDLVVVADGATIRTETGCGHGAAWYTRKLGAAVIAGAASRSTLLTTVLAHAIGEVAALHPECRLSHPGTPSAGIAIVRFEGDVLCWLALGDVTIVLDTTDGLKVVSDQRVSATAAAERAEVDRHLIGSPEKAAALLPMKHAELAARNRPGGYWIAAADPVAVDHAITGEVAVDMVQRLAVLTDGAARAVDMFGLYQSWLPALDDLEKTGAHEFIQRIRQVEAGDPRGVMYPRNKVSDDASAVLAHSILGSAERRQVTTQGPLSVLRGSGGPRRRDSPDPPRRSSPLGRFSGRWWSGAVPDCRRGPLRRLRGTQGPFRGPSDGPATRRRYPVLA